MSKNIKGAIPKWRFLEFRDSGEWEEKELNESLDYLQPTQYLVQSENYSNNYETPVLTAGKSFVLGYTNEKDGIFNNKLPVIIFDDFTTDSKFVDFPFKVKSSAIKILLAKYNFNIKFIFEIMQMVSYEVSVHKRHWISIFSKLKVLIPKLPEQQKIADCLSSIDDLISVEEKKLSLLNDYKKGWMQKLFPAEGKTVPEWRFPEFMNSGDWEENNLKKVLIKNSMKNKNQKYSLIESISNKFGFVRQDKYFENRRVASKNTSNYYVIKKGYFAYNPSRIDVGSLAYKYDDRTSIISPLYVSFKANNDVIDDIFLWMFFNSTSFTKQMIFEGGVRNTLNYENLIQIKIFLPNLPEQQKIAGFLSGIDDLVNKQTDRIEALKQHKKALMQGLFPATEEVW